MKKALQRLVLSGGGNREKMFQVAAASSSAGSGDDEDNTPPPSPSQLLLPPSPSQSQFLPPLSPLTGENQWSPSYSVQKLLEEEAKKIQQEKEEKRLELLKKAVNEKSELDYWHKMWEMKSQGRDSECERAMMTKEEMEVWGQLKEEEAEAIDGRIWEIEDKIFFWEEKKSEFAMESKYWESIQDGLYDLELDSLSDKLSLLGKRSAELNSELQALERTLVSRERSVRLVNDD